MISIVVPVKNGLEYTRPFVESVHAANPEAAIEWIVVDSGSTDGTLEFCASLGAIVVPFERRPFNYCAAINAGAARASGDVWLICNNDLLFRSAGDLARVERLFREWPVLGALSPGRPAGAAELEFRWDGVNGATWAVRPSLFRAWGGMPEQLTGYGWDEAHTALELRRLGRCHAWLTGWDVLHHGSATFGPEGGNVSPALRRNLSRLLKLYGARDLDTRAPVERILERLYEREGKKAPVRLLLPPALDDRWATRQGFPMARPLSRLLQEPGADSAGAALVVGDRASADRRQWLPWLMNELLLQPDAVQVGDELWKAVRTARVQQLGVPPAPPRAVGPEAPMLMPPVPEKRPTLRQRLAAWRHAWRRRHERLPDEW